MYVSFLVTFLSQNLESEDGLQVVVRYLDGVPDVLKLA